MFPSFAAGFWTHYLTLIYPPMMILSYDFTHDIDLVLCIIFSKPIFIDCYVVSQIYDFYWNVNAWIKKCFVGKICVSFQKHIAKKLHPFYFIQDENFYMLIVQHIIFVIFR